MEFLEMFTVLQGLWAPRSSETFPKPKISTVTELPAPPIRPIRSYQGNGVVLIAERSPTGELLGFTELGNCSELIISAAINFSEYAVFGNMHLYPRLNNLINYSDRFVALLFKGLQTTDNSDKPEKVRVEIFKAKFNSVESGTVRFECCNDRLRSKSGGFFSEVSE